jgi:4-amino-4-deoxy-L-arabinose transferase-like glycosyltransferase
MNQASHGSFRFASFGWWLLLGVAVRLVALNQPLVDAQAFRQTLTALMVRSMMAEPGWPVGGVATWRGDLPARLVQELPLYNYLIMPLARLTGQLDASGKLVSVFLWAASFVVLQRLWQRWLNARQKFWANLIFVLAPLSVFFGQAFMPEMLVQLLAFAFLLALVRYQEHPMQGRLLLAAGVGLLGMLVKGPELLHLGLLGLVLVFQKEGIRALRRPLYWFALMVVVAASLGWSHVMDAANARYFPECTSYKNLIYFLGGVRDRFMPSGYFNIALYLTLFVLTPAGVLLAVAGAWRLFRKRPWGLPALWCLSIVFFYVFWSGPVARQHSYYNLPALAPCALLFGLGVDWLWNRRFGAARPAPRWAPAALLLAALAPFLLGAGLYLFRPDPVIVESTRWLREHTRPEDLILVKANHRNDAVDFTWLAPFPYYAQRRCWIYSRFVPAEERQRALATSAYALVTLPPKQVSRLEGWRRWLKRERFTPDNIDDVLHQAGFHPVYTNADFVVLARPGTTAPGG